MVAAFCLGRGGGPNAARVSGVPVSSTTPSGAPTCCGQGAVDAPAHGLDLEALLRRPLGERRSVATRRDPCAPPRCSAIGCSTGRGRRSATVRCGARVPHRERRSRRGGTARRSDRPEFGVVAPPGSVARAFPRSGGAVVRGVPGGRRRTPLTGEANDYVGKGMGGGRIAIVRRPTTTPAIRGSPGTPCSTARPAASCSSPDVPASGSPCGTRARWRSSRASGITRAST